MSKGLHDEDEIEDGELPGEATPALNERLEQPSATMDVVVPAVESPNAGKRGRLAQHGAVVAMQQEPVQGAAPIPSATDANCDGVNGRLKAGLAQVPTLEPLEAHGSKRLKVDRATNSVSGLFVNASAAPTNAVTSVALEEHIPFEYNPSEAAVSGDPDLFSPSDPNMHSSPEEGQIFSNPPSPTATLRERSLHNAKINGIDASYNSLLKNKKLCLVLDLDHTLLNSVKFTEVDEPIRIKLEHRSALEIQQFMPDHPEHRQLFRLPRVNMWTKLRPGVRQFLEKAHQYFELWIHTNGTRSYALAMVDLLDPNRQYFGDRIISQGVTSNDETAQVKSLMSGLEGREPVTIIVDDSSAVWPNDLRNLCVVERYIYFPTQKKVAEGISLLEIDRDECPESGMLMTALDVILRVYERVFAYYRSEPRYDVPESDYPLWDVRNVLAEERAKVLSGVSIVFSRVIPLHEDPKTHYLWILAESHGAECSVSASERTTHVVAPVGGTEKVIWALTSGKHVVTPQWLEASCILWSRADEDRFRIAS